MIPEVEAPCVICFVDNDFYIYGIICGCFGFYTCGFYGFLGGGGGIRGSSSSKSIVYMGFDYFGFD